MKQVALVCLLATQATARADAAPVVVHDVGIFSELDSRLSMPTPPRERVHAIHDQARGNVVLYEGSWPVAIYPASAWKGELDALLRQPVELPPGDRDGDGIPDPLDVSLGAEKTALNADRYDGRYQELAYPGGDVPREIGVCTDVIVRAMRNAGIDLQRAVHEDIARAPSAYPMVKRPNASIDHRRVRSLLPYFQRHLEAHGTQLDEARDPLRAGDVLFMDTFPDRPGPEHVGIVAAARAKNGLPLVINNWTNGTRTAHMELLSWVPVTHRFRLPAQAQSPIAPWTPQLLVVTSEGWNSAQGELTRYARVDGTWRKQGEGMHVILGLAGYAWGDGLHGRGPARGRTGPRKREGDGRSPAGVYALGPWRGEAAQLETKLGYRPIDSAQVCVDDPRSRAYNQVTAQDADYRTAERMQRSDGMYALALDVQHNVDPVAPGHGSCIFLHVAERGARLTGCVGLARQDLQALAHWLAPEALLVALPRSEYAALRSSWGLP